MDNLRHFQDSEWVDFVHSLLPAARSLELQAHIDRSCSECIRSANFWRAVDRFLALKPHEEAPATTIGAIEDLFAPQRPWLWLRDSAVYARKVFDSLQQPALSFVRGSRSSDRHLIYEAGPFVIDVTLRADPTLSSVSLVGQVLNSAKLNGAAGEEIHVVLLSGGDLIAKTVAASSGEFELRCEAKSDLSLFISIRGERAIGLSLHESDNSDSHQ